MSNLAECEVWILSYTFSYLRSSLNLHNKPKILPYCVKLTSELKNPVSISTFFLFWIYLSRNREKNISMKKENRKEKIEGKKKRKEKERKEKPKTISKPPNSISTDSISSSTTLVPFPTTLARLMIEPNFISSSNQHEVELPLHHRTITTHPKVSWSHCTAMTTSHLSDPCFRYQSNNNPLHRLNSSSSQPFSTSPITSKSTVAARAWQSYFYQLQVPNLPPSLCHSSSIQTPHISPLSKSVWKMPQSNLGPFQLKDGSDHGLDLNQI